MRFKFDANLISSTERFSTSTEKSNKKLVDKLKMISLIYASIYFFALLLPGLAELISVQVAQYLPSIQKLRSPPPYLDGFTHRYFASAAALAIPMTIWLVWGQDVYARFRHQQARSGRGMMETLFIFYLLGLPALLSVIFIMGAAPFSITDGIPNKGTITLNLMLSSYIGLFVFGTLLNSCISLFIAWIILMVWLPFATLIHYLKGYPL